MTVLVAVPGVRDPYGPGPRVGMDGAGPVLVAATRLAVDAVILAELPMYGARTEETGAALRERLPGLRLLRVPVPLAMPEDLAAAIVAVDRLHADIPRLIPAAGEIWMLLPDGEPGMSLALLRAAGSARRPVRYIRVRPPFAGGGAEALLCEVMPPRGGVCPGRLREPKADYVTGAAPAATHVRHVPGPANLAAGMGVVAGHPSMQRVLATVGSVAPHAVPVLIQGETGTGKGLCARLLHALGPSPEGPFVSVNCSALPETLMESQLFGHRKGAFTGAVEDYEGFFARAHGGTLFLDEIGELPLHLQPKLLKVLEDGEVQPLGGCGGTPVQTRILAATNHDLRTAVAEKRFREDLYYRLAFAIVEMPPLRERRSDIPALALQMLDRINQSIASPCRLSRGALKALKRAQWPGNVRDLENLIGRSVLLARGNVLQVSDLAWEHERNGAATETRIEPRLPSPPPSLGVGFSLEAYLTQLRARIILQALEQADGNCSEAGRLLGLSRQAVAQFLKTRPVRADRDPGGGDQVPAARGGCASMNSAMRSGSSSRKR